MNGTKARPLASAWQLRRLRSKLSIARAEAELEAVPFYTFPIEARRIVYTKDEMDNRFVEARRAILSWRGQNRGEERGA